MSTSSHRRRRRRRSGRAVLYRTVGFFLVLIIATLGVSVFLRIMEIEVTGASRYSEEEVIAASGISVGDNMLFMDRETIIRKIRSVKPYINDVKIELAPPAGIRIIIKESKAVAVLKNQGGYLVVDPAGRVLSNTTAVPDGLIEIRGFTPSEAVVGSKLRAEEGGETQLRNLTEILTALEKAEIEGKVSYLDVTNIAYPTFEYSGLYTVLLGSTSNVDHKLEQLISAIIPDVLNREGSVPYIINMSDPTGKWTGRVDNR